MTSKSIHSEIEINAPVAKVWAILMDFEKYPSWNPFIKSLRGKAEAGQKLKVVLHQPGSPAMLISPKCLVCKENKEFRWIGHLMIPGIFDGEHIFILRSISERKTKLVQSENFRGFLLPFFWKMLNTKTLKGFEMMNRALKERAES